MPAQFVDEGTFVGRQDDLGVLRHALAEVDDEGADADATVSGSEQ